MGPIAFVGDRIQSFKKSSDGFFKAVLGMPSDSSRRSPIERLKRLQREVFSDVMKLRDRQDKMERLLSFYKSCKESPFDEVSTHIKGIVDLLNCLLFVDNSQQACNTLHKAGRRIGIDIRFIFETAVRQKDTLIAELVTSPSNIGYLSDVLGNPLVLDKVKYTSNINDQLSAIAVPFGARTTDFEIGPGVPQGLPQFGPPLYSERQDCAGGLMFKGSNFAVSSAVLVSQLAPLTSSTADRCCWSTFAQLTYQTYKEMVCAVSGLWQMPSRPGQPIKLGPLSIPIGFPKRSLALSDAQGWQPSSSSVTILRRFIMAKPISIEVWNPSGKYRVVSTKPMPGTRWINLLTAQDCRVEICTEKKTILSVEDILALIGDKCDGVIGQLTEDWGEVLFSALKRAGGTAFSNMAVGYNNVDVSAANKYGVAVGNTPGVLTETTAELAAALSLAAARRIVEADQFMRAGLYDGWLPHLFVGNLLKGQTVGVIGAGRIGSAYARMMVEGFKMNLLYYDLYQSTRLEKFVTAYGQFLKANGEQPVTWKRAATMVDVLREADVISLHPVLDKTTYHLINKDSLAIMKKEAILVNASRGPVIDEAALVEHLKANPMFRVGLDVFEDEPYMKPGLAELKNAVVVPHIASASKWTREGMATLSALNVLGKIKGFPIWSDPNRVDVFLNEKSLPPLACPSIVNAKHLGIYLISSNFRFLNV
ncbi:putative oxidoreductase [Dioscorea sansibarensis]